MPLSDTLLAHACPLTHPDDFTVRVRDKAVQLYRGGCLEILGEQHRVYHRWRENAHKRAGKEPDNPEFVAFYRKLEEDPALRAQVLATCSQPDVRSFLFWINWFGWTFVQKEIDPRTGLEVVLSGRACVRPFATWPCQDRAAAELYAAMTEGFDVTLDKSRQMGATWLACAMLLWFVLFRPSSHFAVMSRTEDLVDNSGDPQSIFWKISYMLSHLPTWMQQGVVRQRLKLINLLNGSTIMGRSTTGEQGRGGAVMAAFIDEASQIDELEAVWTSFGQSTACRIANSTPYGAGYFSALVRNPAVYGIKLPWWEHPLKGRGRHVETDPNNREVFISSPFYVAQCRRASPDPTNWQLGRKTRDVAQELDMDHSGSGRLVFDYAVIARQLALCPANPSFRGELKVNTEPLLRAKAIRDGDISVMDVEEQDRGKWEFWIDLVEDDAGFMRPPQNKGYVIAADIAQGVGASESVSVVYCVEEQRKVAQYRDANISPVRFAMLNCAAGWWWGGVRGFSFHIFESNGGYGQAYKAAVVKLRYPWVYADTDETGRTPQVSRRLGWHSTRPKKLREFELLRAAMAAGEFQDPSRASLDQMLTIIHYEGGGCGPASYEHLSEDARSLHGDIATANALAWYGATKMGMARIGTPPPPAGSAEWRRRFADSIIARKPGLRSERKRGRERPNPFASRR